MVDTVGLPSDLRTVDNSDEVFLMGLLSSSTCSGVEVCVLNMSRLYIHRLVCVLNMSRLYIHRLVSTPTH